MKSHDFFSVVPRALLVLTLLLVGCMSTALADDPPNPILKEMLEKGLDTGGGVLVKLPAPTMADGLDAAAQKKALMTITDANKTLPRILEKSDNATFQFKVTAAAGHKTAYHIDMWYVAYGSLNVVANKQFLKGLGPAPAAQGQAAPADKQKLPNKSDELTPEDLAERKIVMTTGLDERYGYSLFELMDKVYLSITSRSVQTTHKESILMAGYIDPRFVNDPKFPDQWQPITQNAVGLPVLGKASPYTGAGGYMKVTELKEPQGALFIEGHLIYNEPHGWFNGASLLRSKLPILAKDNVVTFRKKLRQAMAQQGQAAGKQP